MPVHFSDDPWTRVTTKRGYAADELISMLQKTIRRGETKLALLAGRELFESSPELEEMMWSRLLVISCEDCGDGTFLQPLVVNNLYAMHERLDRSFGDRWLFAVHAIRYLAESIKDRTSDEYANLSIHWINSSERPFEVPAYAVDVHTRRGQLEGRTVDDFWNEGSTLVNERAGRTRELKDEIQELRATGRWQG